MTEIWKDIPDYENIYQISNFGRVKSLSRKVKSPKGYRKVKERILKPSTSTKYKLVVLKKEGNQKSMYIHHLVAICFLNHDPSLSNLVIDHKDENPLNNRFDNLQIITIRKNISKGYSNKKTSSKYTGVAWFERDKKWLSQIRIDGKLKHIGYFDNEIDAHNAYQKELKKLNKL